MNRETAKETRVPIKSKAISMPVNWKPNFTIFKRLAPNITGMARKNVNSAATVRLTPIIRAPTMVAPEREVPGKTAAISWNAPMMRAVLKVMSYRLLTLGFFLLFQFSTKINASPNAISAMATQKGL